MQAGHNLVIAAAVAAMLLTVASSLPVAPWSSPRWSAGPAQAQDLAPRPAVGEVPDPADIRPVVNHGEYGLGPGVAGSVYAIVAGHLVRIDIHTGQVVSILRPVPARED